MTLFAIGCSECGRAIIGGRCECPSGPTWPLAEMPCSRCNRPIKDFNPPNKGMTAGYYVAEAWQKYANPGEVYICDSCMWADPRYIADYGVQRIEAMPNTPTDAPLAEAETDEARYEKYDTGDGDPQWWRVNELRGEGTGDARTMVLSVELHAALDAIAARDTRVRELEAERNAMAEADALREDRARLDRWQEWDKALAAIAARKEEG